MHHIVSDGWSLERPDPRGLGALRGLPLAASPRRCPSSPIQYADYAAWQRDWLQGEVLRQQLDYWTEQLAGLRAPGAAHRSAPARRRQRPRRRARTRPCPGPRSTRCAALGRQEGATLYMTLLAAFQVLLHRYSGQDDIAVGSPIAGRSRPELEGLIGFFVNTLVLRGDLSGDPGFRELLRRTRRTAIDAYAHQDLPFERLVTALQPRPRLGPLAAVPGDVRPAERPACRRC